MSQKHYLILDFDECLFEHPADSEEYFCQAYAEIAVKAGYPFPLEVAKQHTYRCFQDHGLGNYVFDGYGFNIWDIYEDIHVNLFHNYIKQFSDEISIRQLRKYFDRDDLEMVILTHGPTSWAKNILPLLQLDDLFPDERIIGLDKVDYRTKCTTARPFLTALKALGLSRSDVDKGTKVTFVDDSARNLKMPNSLGMETVHIGPRITEFRDADFIHHRFDNLWQFLEQLPRLDQASSHQSKTA